MKNFLMVMVIFMCFPILLPAQNFNVIVENTTAEGAPGDEIIMGGHIFNLSDNAISIEIVRETNEIPGSWTSSLCLTVCALPWTDQLSSEIAAGDSTEFSIHFFTDAQPGAGEALLKIRESSGSDSVSYLFKASTMGTGILSNEAASHSFRLYGNYPNPFNNSTIIQFDVAQPIHSVQFQVFSVLGKRIFEERINNVTTGVNRIRYSGRDAHGNVIPSGTYFYRLTYLTANGLQQSTKLQKLALVK